MDEGAYQTYPGCARWNSGLKMVAQLIVFIYKFLTSIVFFSKFPVKREFCFLLGIRFLFCVINAIFFISRCSCELEILIINTTIHVYAFINYFFLIACDFIGASVKE